MNEEKCQAPVFNATEVLNNQAEITKATVEFLSKFNGLLEDRLGLKLSPEPEASKMDLDSSDILSVLVAHQGLQNQALRKCFERLEYFANRIS